MSFWAYILRCADETYYTGHTDDLEARTAQHNHGELPGFTTSRRPVKLVWSQDFQTRDDAFRAEMQIKNWSRKKKEALIRGDWDDVRFWSAPPGLRVSRHGISTSSMPARHERGWVGYA